MPKTLDKHARPYAKDILYAKGPQRSFTGQDLDQIAFPLGGIGAGQINLGGSGDLIDFSIFNRPALGKQPMAFATVTAMAPGKSNVARVIEGPVTQSRIYRNGEYGSGFHVGHEGLPHMKQATFRGEFPFAEVDFKDPDLPLNVSLEAWSPFIPLDDHHSSMPTGVLTYTVKNRSRKPLRAMVAFHLQHMIEARPGNTRGSLVVARKTKDIAGLAFSNTELDADNPRAATFALGCPEAKSVLKAGWFRGRWYDPRTMLWGEIERGKLEPSARSKPVAGHPLRNYTGGSIGVPLNLKPGETRSVSFILAWHVPNCDITFGWPDLEEAVIGDCATGVPCCDKNDERVWRPYYAGKWKDASAVARYVARNLSSLHDRSARFRDVFFSSTLPPYVLDAVSANLGILKSPTCLRLEDGTFWGYEGCRPEMGCCPGSCTHVWNYAQAIPHLFPALERNLRSLEYEVSMNDEGNVRFRTPLPPTAPKHDFPAAADGQLGGVMKVYRDWQISGDDEWLKRFYPLAKRSLDFCSGLWDPDQRGALFESHHNTYDIEFFGPDGMCTSVYLGALRAMAEMADYLGDAENAKRCRALADKGRRYSDRSLFNGEYYYQRIMTTGLRRNFQQTARYKDYSPEAKALARREGPKYQYGKGCLSDGVIGQWFAEEYGLPDALDPEKTRSTLASIFRYNFKPDLSRHANPQRAAYALNDEAGLLLCSWPRGDKLSLPFVYSDEVWTGIEYQVAAHLIRQGMVDEGLTIVKATRDRYDGFRRNPWNEYECGSYYARAMASYAVLMALTGFRYSAVSEELVLDPRLDGTKLVSFFSTAKAWGRVIVKRPKRGAITIAIEVEEGRLSIRSLRVPEAIAADCGKPITVASVTGSKSRTDITRQGAFINARLSRRAIATPDNPIAIKLA